MITASIVTVPDPFKPPRLTPLHIPIKGLSTPLTVACGVRPAAANTIFPSTLLTLNAMYYVADQKRAEERPYIHHCL